MSQQSEFRAPWERTVEFQKLHCSWDPIQPRGTNHLSGLFHFGLHSCTHWAWVDFVIAEIQLKIWVTLLCSHTSSPCVGHTIHKMKKSNYHSLLCALSPSLMGNLRSYWVQRLVCHITWRVATNAAEKWAYHGSHFHDWSFTETGGSHWKTRCPSAAMAKWGLLQYGGEQWVTKA